MRKKVLFLLSSLAIALILGFSAQAEALYSQLP